jgi:hypothetical protein
LEIAAVKLTFFKEKCNCILCISGSYGRLWLFLKQLDIILNSLYNPKTEFTFCGN